MRNDAPQRVSALTLLASASSYPPSRGRDTRRRCVISATRSTTGLLEPARTTRGTVICVKSSRRVA